jgi:hypothetical protein
VKYWRHLLKSVEKIQVWLKSEKYIIALYMRTQFHLWFYIADFFLDEEEFLIKVVEKIKTHISCQIHFF